MVLDTTLINSQHYKVRIKGKVEQSRERNNALPTTQCCRYWKGSLWFTLDYGCPLYLYIYIYIYILKIMLEHKCIIFSIYIYIYTKIYIYPQRGSACGIMIIVVGNPEFKSWAYQFIFSHCTKALGKGMHPTILPPEIDK